MKFLTVIVLALFGVANAQFGNLFDHMFRQQTQQPQDSRHQVPEGSNWVEHEYEKGV
jgi:hypothetical protein